MRLADFEPKKVKERRFLRNLASKRKAKLARQLENGVPPYEQNNRRKKRKQLKTIKVSAPAVFSLANAKSNRNMFEFLRSLRTAFQLRPKRVLVCFKSTAEMHSCGTLLFVAELDRAVRLFESSVRIACSYPNDEKVEKVLQQIGILALFGKKERQVITEVDKDVYHWRYCTGTNADPTPIESLMGELTSKLHGSIGTSLGSAIGEAITNSTMHAYISSRDDGLPRFAEKRWWIFAEVVDQRLIVVTCDLGVGIPATLQRNWSETLQRLFHSTPRHEGKLIEAAFEIGRTRTELAKQGKGMADLKKVIDKLKDGLLTVYSNKGVASFKYSDNELKTVISGTEGNIKGTLVQWSIPLAGAGSL